MAFNKENFYQEGNSQEFFFSRTNPLANPANAEILKIKKSGCCESDLALVAEYGYEGVSNSFDIYFLCSLRISYVDHHDDTSKDLTSILHVGPILWCV